MTGPTLEQVINIARDLPPEALRSLREWIEEQEREAETRHRKDYWRHDEERFQDSLRWGDEYLGQWVALDGDRLISHGPDAKKVYEEARATGVHAPFLKRIVKDDLPFGGW
jgi:Family of unknown function (DUF5678)